MENGNCYCVRIDYDDNNEEVEEKEEEEEEEQVDEEEEEEKIQGTSRKLLSMALILPGYNEV